MASLRDVNLNRLIVFAAVVEAGSITGAAARLGLAKTMVSTHIQRLESEVGTSLLVRTTRRLNLTDAGHAFYAACSQFLQAAEQALSAISHQAGPLQGSLRVAAPIDYGTLVVTPALVALRQAHPKLEIELLCNDRHDDLVAGGIDVAIRLGRLQDSTYRAVKLGEYVRWLVASPAFIAAWGLPDSPAALADLPGIALSILPHPHTFLLQNAEGERQSLRCNNLFFTNTAPACRAALLAGGGFGFQTVFSIDEDLAAGRLVRLLPAWSSESFGIQAVFPSASHTSPKVHALIAAIRARLQPSAHAA